jgi:hypothetical protein
MRLADRIAQIDTIQARRYNRLTGYAREIATKGIIRHLNACERYEVEPDKAAVREIIDDAQYGRAVYEEIGKPLRRLR